jgi:hypothetical protein
MLNDLSDALAALTWARDQTADFENRVNKWLHEHRRIEVVEAGGDAEYDMVVAGTTEEVPRAFSVELGAYLNTLRSSLDILASTLAVRAGQTDQSVAAFPFANTAADFGKETGRARVFLNSLPDAERDIIEGFKPYGDGDPALWALHRLDIMRKHRRLLGVEIKSRMLQFSNTGMKNGEIKTLMHWDVYDATGQVVAMIKKGAATRYEFDIVLHLRFDEEGEFGSAPVFHLMQMMINKVDDIISMFQNIMEER